MEENGTDQHFMSRAMGLAQAAARQGEVPVGALLYDPAGRRVIAEAANAPIARHDPSAHAEILALRAAGAALGNYRLPGLWLYVTLEPCAMCAAAIAHARVSRLIFGAADPKGGAVISGVRFFDQPTCHHRPALTGGVLATQSAALLKGFFRDRRSAP